MIYTIIVMFWAFSIWVFPSSLWFIQCTALYHQTTQKLNQGLAASVLLKTMGQDHFWSCKHKSEMILPHFVIQFLCDLINFQKIFHPIAPLRLLFRNHEICSRGRKAATTSEPKFKQKRWTTANENGEELLFVYWKRKDI